MKKYRCFLCHEIIDDQPVRIGDTYFHYFCYRICEMRIDKPNILRSFSRKIRGLKALFDENRLFHKLPHKKLKHDTKIRSLHAGWIHEPISNFIEGIDNIGRETKHYEDVAKRERERLEGEIYAESIEASEL